MKQLLVLLLAAGLLLAACGSSRASTPPPAHPSFVGLTTHITCPLPSGHSSDLAVLDPDFRPVAAVRCAERQRIYPGHGRWLVWRQLVLTRGVGRLAAWYERPSLPRSNSPCLQFANGVDPTAFVDKHSLVIPRWPVDGCGHVLAGQPKNLHWRLVSVRRIRRVGS